MKDLAKTYPWKNETFHVDILMIGIQEGEGF